MSKNLFSNTSISNDKVETESWALVWDELYPQVSFKPGLLHSVNNMPLLHFAHESRVLSAKIGVEECVCERHQYIHCSGIFIKHMNQSSSENLLLLWMWVWFVSLKIQYVLEENLLARSFIAPSVIEAFSNDCIWLTLGTQLSCTATSLSDHWQVAKHLIKHVETISFTHLQKIRFQNWIY